MNIDSLIKRYFSAIGQPPTIEVFDEESIHRVYSDIVNILKYSPEIELGVLQLLSYCLYEILDNVITHSGKNCGTVILRFLSEKNTIQILVADDGKGIYKSLSENHQYNNISEKDAVMMCLQDRVTDGKGMGFGLFSTLCLIRNAGIRLEIHSGAHLLVSDGKIERVIDAPQWQGTIVYLEIHSNKEIQPNEILLNRTDVENQFNDEFIDTEDIDNLW